MDYLVHPWARTLTSERAAPQGFGLCQLVFLPIMPLVRASDSADKGLFQIGSLVAAMTFWWGKERTYMHQATTFSLMAKDLFCNSHAAPVTLTRPEPYL